MKKFIILLPFAVLLLIAVTLSASPEAFSCAQCGMTSDLGSKFSSKIDQGAKTLFFCDIGDLLFYINEKKPKSLKAQVKDFVSNEWIDAQKAFYVHAGNFKSPMGWAIAAFKNREEAAAYAGVMDFEAALRAVR